jgi:hypothetical protein
MCMENWRFKPKNFHVGQPGPRTMESWLACSPACACIVSMMYGAPSSFSGQHRTLGQTRVLHAGEGASAIRMRWRRCRATEAVVHHMLQRAPWTTLPRERGIAAAGGGAHLHLAILEAGPSWQACVVPRFHPGLLPGRPHWEQDHSGSRWDTSCLLYLPPMLRRVLPWI